MPFDFDKVLLLDMKARAQDATRPLTPSTLDVFLNELLNKNQWTITKKNLKTRIEDLTPLVHTFDFGLKDIVSMLFTFNGEVFEELLERIANSPSILDFEYNDANLITRFAMEDGFMLGKQRKAISRRGTLTAPEKMPSDEPVQPSRAPGASTLVSRVSNLGTENRSPGKKRPAAMDSVVASKKRKTSELRRAPEEVKELSDAEPMMDQKSCANLQNPKTPIQVKQEVEEYVDTENHHSGVFDWQAMLEYNESFGREQNQEEPVQMETEQPIDEPVAGAIKTKVEPRKAPGTSEQSEAPCQSTSSTPSIPPEAVSSQSSTDLLIISQQETAAPASPPPTICSIQLANAVATLAFVFNSPEWHQKAQNQAKALASAQNPIVKLEDFSDTLKIVMGRISKSKTRSFGIGSITVREILTNLMSALVLPLGKDVMREEIEMIQEECQKIDVLKKQFVMKEMQAQDWHVSKAKIEEIIELFLRVTLVF